MNYVATRQVHHDGEAYQAGQLLKLDAKNPQHKVDVDELVRVGAAKPAEEVEALNGMSIPKLKELATAEDIPLPEAAKDKPAIVSVIVAARAHRADQAKGSTED